MLFSTTAAGATVTIFSDGNASVVVELRDPGNYQDDLSGSISLPEGETITSASFNVSTQFSSHDDFISYDQSIMPPGGGGIWDPRVNNGLTTYSDANCHHPTNLMDCSFSAEEEYLALSALGYSADFETGEQGMVPGPPVEGIFNWERKMPGGGMTGGLMIPPHGCAMGNYCWGTNFDDPDYTDDTQTTTSFEYILETPPIWVHPTKGSGSFNSWHSLNYRASGVNRYYEDCAYVAYQDSSDGNAWSPWAFLNFDLGNTTGLQQGSQGLFQKVTTPGTIGQVQNNCNGKGTITVPPTSWVLAGESTSPNNQNGWANIGLDLTSSENKYVRLRFTLERNPIAGTPVNATMPGWYIDTLQIGDPLPQSGSVVMSSFTATPPLGGLGFPEGYGVLDVEVATTGPGSFTVDILDASNGQVVLNGDGVSMSGLEGELIELWDIDTDQYGLIDLRFNFDSGLSRMNTPVMHGFTLGTKIGTSLNSSAGLVYIGGNFANGQWTSDSNGGIIGYSPSMIDNSWSPPLTKSRFKMPIIAAKPVISDSCGSSGRQIMLVPSNNLSGSLTPTNNQWVTFAAPSTGVTMGLIYSTQCTVYSMWLEVRFAHTMSNVELDVAGDGDLEWGITESAYGSLGRQQMFRTQMINGINYGADNTTLSMSIVGQAEGAVFFLPKGATIDHAELSFDNADIGNATIELLAGPSSQLLGSVGEKERATPDDALTNDLAQFAHNIQALMDNSTVPVSHIDGYGNEWIQFRFRFTNPSATAASSILLRDLDIFYTWSRTLSDDNNIARELNQGVALGQPIGGEVLVPLKFTSDSGGGLNLNNLSVTTESGYDSTINMSDEWIGLYATGEVYEVVSTHSVEPSTGASIVGASLQFESESGLAEVRWTLANDSFWYARGSDLVSILVALSSSTNTPDGKQITWRFRINPAWQDSETARIFTTLITDSGSEGLPAAKFFNPDGQGNAVENDASISQLRVLNQAGAEQTNLSNVHSSNVFTLEGTVRFENLEVAPDPSSYSLVFESQNASNLTEWSEVDRLSGVLGGNFSWQPVIPELSAGNDTFRLRLANYTGGNTICPPAALSPDIDCGIPMTVYIDQYAPFLVNISVWDGIQHWRDLQDDTWIPPQANQKFRVIVRDIPQITEQFTLNYWVEAQHDNDSNRLPELSEYQSVPLTIDSTDANGNTTYYISNVGCPPSNDCIDDRQTGFVPPTGEPAPRTSLFVSGSDISGNEINGGGDGFIYDLITYIGKPSIAPQAYSLHVGDAFGNPLTEFNKSMFAGNIYHLFVDGRDDNGWRDVAYVKVDLNPAYNNDLVLFFSPRNGTAWTESTSAEFLSIENDGIKPRATRLDGTALIDPFETEFLVDMPIRLKWGVTTLQGVITPEVFMKDLDPDNSETKLSSSRYIQRWSYSDGLKFDVSSFGANDTSGFITTSVGGLDGGFVRPGDLLQIKGDYLFKSALEGGIFVQPEIPMTLEITRIPIYPGGESDKPGSGYVAAATEVSYNSFYNGSFDLIIPAALSTNEYRYVFRMCTAADATNVDCEYTLPVGATDFSIEDDRTFYVKVDNQAPTVVWGSWNLESSNSGETYSDILPSSTIHCVNIDFAIEEKQKLMDGSMQINWMYYYNDLNWSQYRSTFPDAWQTAELDLDLTASPNRASVDCLDLWPGHNLPSDLDGVDVRFWVSGTDSAGNGITLAGQFGSAVEGGEYALTYQEAEFRIDRVMISPGQPEAGQMFEILVDVTNVGTDSGELKLEIFIVIEGKQSGNFNHSCGTVYTPSMSEICRVQVDAFPEPISSVKFKIHDMNGNELGESESFHIRAAGSSSAGGTNWALYGGVAAVIIVLIALVVGIMMFMGNREDDDDFFIEDEDYLPHGEAAQPMSRGGYPTRAQSEDYGDYGTRSAGTQGYGGGGPPVSSGGVPPGAGESQMDRAKRLFPQWDEGTIQGYFDQGWSIQQLQDWVQENK
jgi:hypothetical protein